MVTLVIILALGLIGSFIYLFEKYKEEQFIAKYVDGQQVSANFITEGTQKLVDQLKEPNSLRIKRYTNTVLLPDGQELCYLYDNQEKMEERSRLNFEPTPQEWKILRGILKKLYPTIKSI
jgi:hypothetical protein